MTVAELTPLVLHYRYWIIIPISFIEGPIIAFVTGTLAKLGYFNPYIAFLIFFFRDVVLDSSFYFLGKYGGRTALAQKLLTKLGVGEQHLADVRVLWDEHGFRTMFFSKLSYGLSATFLVVAGMVDMAWSRFLYYAALVALAQYGILFVLGYYFANMLGTVSNALDMIQYVVGGGLLAATIYYIFSKYMAKKLVAQEHTDRINS